MVLPRGGREEEPKAVRRPRARNRRARDPPVLAVPEIAKPCRAVARVEDVAPAGAPADVAAELPRQHEASGAKASARARVDETAVAIDEAHAPVREPSRGLGCGARGDERRTSRLDLDAVEARPPADEDRVALGRERGGRVERRQPGRERADPRATQVDPPDGVPVAAVPGGEGHVPAVARDPLELAWRNGGEAAHLDQAVSAEPVKALDDGDSPRRMADGAHRRLRDRSPPPRPPSPPPLDALFEPEGL